MRLARAFTFYLLLSTVLLSGCNKENAPACVKSTGTMETQLRPLPSFHTLRVFDNPEIIIVPDSVTYAEVYAGKNLQENIVAEVKNGELFLRNINKCNWVRSYKKPVQIRVHTPRIINIFHDGDGLLSSEGPLPADTLFLHLTGAGDADFDLNSKFVWVDMYELAEARLRGVNQHLAGFVFSLGSLKAPDLRNQEVNLKLTHQGQAFVQATQLLQAEISGPGNVFYQGEPANIRASGPGPGQVKKLE